MKQWDAYESQIQQDFGVQEDESKSQTKSQIISQRKTTSKTRVTERPKHLYGRRTWIHAFFVLYAFIAGITAILLAIAQLIGFTIQDFPLDTSHDSIQDVQKDFQELPDEFNQALHYFLAIFLIIMCFFALLTELEWCKCLNSCVMKFWVTRGIVYLGMGYLSLYQLNNGGGKKDENESIFIQDVSYTFMGVGAGYSVMGMLCLQTILERIRLDYRARKYGYKTSSTETPPTDLVLDDDKEVI